MLIKSIQLLYIDPGAGSLLFQMILSGLLTVAVFFKRIMAMVKGVLPWKKNLGDNPDEERSRL